MRARILLFSVLPLLFTIVAVQNTAEIDVSLVFWDIKLPLIVLIMVIFLVGLVMGLLVSSLFERKKRNAGAVKTSNSKPGYPLFRSEKSAFLLQIHF